MNTWVFHGNPEHFDITSCLALQPQQLSWLATRYQDDMKVGDRVFLWRSTASGTEEGGVVGLAEIISEPSPNMIPSPCSDMWKTEREKLLWAGIRVLDLGDGVRFVPRVWLKRDPLFRDHELIQARQPTNFSLSRAEGDRLRALWSQCGRDWSEPELITLLWAYAPARGSRPATGPTGFVDETALSLGRPVPAVYEKMCAFYSGDPGNRSSVRANVDTRLLELFNSYYDHATDTLDLVRLEYASQPNAHFDGND